MSEFLHFPPFNFPLSVIFVGEAILACDTLNAAHCFYSSHTFIIFLSANQIRFQRTKECKSLDVEVVYSCTSSNSIFTNAANFWSVAITSGYVIFWFSFINDGRWNR